MFLTIDLQRKMHFSVYLCINYSFCYHNNILDAQNPTDEYLHFLSLICIAVNKIGPLSLKRPLVCHFTRWQATKWPELTSLNSGMLSAHFASA